MPDRRPSNATLAARGPIPRRVKAVLVLVAAIAFVASPLLVDDFNGFDPQAFPVPQDEPPVQPAGYAFSIWGLIYLWLLVHAGFGLWRRAEDADWDATRWPLFVSLGLGTGWTALANISPVWATVVIWLMLLAALWALRHVPKRDRWLAVGPVALYAGWLSAASWVSIGLLLGGYGIVGFQSAAVIALLFAAGFAFFVQYLSGRGPEYGIAVIWALVAVVIANWGAGWLVPVLAAAAAALIAIATLRAVRLETIDRAR